jgi:tetratricopeptide (TPR) repeat protein
MTPRCSPHFALSALLLLAASAPVSLSSAQAAPPRKASATPTATSLATADRLFTQSRFAEARDAYRSLIKRTPRDGMAHVGLLRTLLRLDRWEEAVAAGDAALKVIPASARQIRGDIAGLRSLALMRGGRPDDAREAAVAARKLHPESYWALVASGGVAVRWDEDHTAAGKWLRHAVALRPQEPEGWLTLSGVYDAENEAGGGAKAVQRYLALKPKGHPHQDYIASIELSIKSSEEYRKALPRDVEPFAMLKPMPEADLQKMVKSGGAYSVTVPIEFEDDEIVLPTKINGQTYRLVFDSGGTDEIVLSETSAKGLNLKPAGQFLSGGIQGTEKSTTYIAETLEMGEMTLGPVEMTAVADGAGKTDGEFGGSILARYCLDFDLTKRTLTMRRGAPVTPAKAGFQGRTLTLPFHYMEGKIMLPLWLGNDRFWAMVDTGATTDVISGRLARHLTSGLHENIYREGTIDRRMGYGQSAKKLRYKAFLRDYTLTCDVPQFPALHYKEGLILSALDEVISPQFDFEMGMIVGWTTLSRFQRIIIDYPNQVLTLEYNDPDAPARLHGLEGAAAGKGPLEDPTHVPAEKPASGHVKVFVANAWKDLSGDTRFRVKMPEDRPPFTVPQGYVALRFADDAAVLRDYSEETQARIKAMNGPWLLVPETVYIDDDHRIDLSGALAD